MFKGTPAFILLISTALQSKTVPSKLPTESGLWPKLASGPFSGVVWRALLAT